MGSLRFAQDHISVTVEWPYGALEVGDFAKTVKAINAIVKAVSDPQSTPLAESLTYDPVQTEEP